MEDQASVFYYWIQWLVFGIVASICSNIGTFFLPQSSLVKGNMLHIESDTHTQLQTHIHTQTFTNPAAIILQSPPIVIWCELLLNLIDHPTLSLTKCSHVTCSCHLNAFLSFFFFFLHNEINKYTNQKCPNSSVNTIHVINLAPFWQLSVFSDQGFFTEEYKT